MQNSKLEIQERCTQFSLSVIRFLEALPERQTTRILGDQLLRSATSVGANVVEAQSASSRRDFINFLTYALKFANETRYWLRLLQETQKVNGRFLSQEAGEVANILGRSILTLKNK